jgi:hypothetical protein
MRTVLPLTVTLAVAFAGCGSEGRGPAAGSIQQRDLTLATAAPQVDIASSVELKNLRSKHRSARQSRLTSRRSGFIRTKPAPAAVAAEPAILLAASPPVTQPASEPANDRELPPGKTVTLIPMSSGPSTATDTTDDLPPGKGRSIVIGSGGTCRGRGRGPGIGIARAPRPDFR